MKSRYALACCAAAAMLAGCALPQSSSDGQPPIAAPGAVSPARAHPVSPAWSLKVILDLHHFRGSHPNAPVVGVNGTLYGTTSTGGKYGRGTLYSVTPHGGHAVLHAFSGAPDGSDPRGGLVYANGTLYGTTWSGGLSDDGTVYSVSPSGSESVIYSFAGGSNGARPVGNLVVVNGTLYGITNEGGDACNSYTLGCGTVYSIGTNGAQKVLHTFTGTPDGAFPYAGLLNVNGTLYGTTASGGGTCENLYNPAVPFIASARRAPRK